jgi:ribosomal protein S12 methylthiotransferase
MISALDAAGWSRVPDPETAAVIIVNSCGFIEPAKQEAIDTVLDFSDGFPNAKIVMAGCLSQRYPGEIAAELPELSGVIGNRAPERVAEFLAAVLNSDERVFVPPPVAEVTKAFPRRNELLSLPGSAYVKVAEGCDNRCSFCAIPLIRGPLRSRGIGDIAAEFRQLLDAGIVEFNLVAQDLASFGRDTGQCLPELLGALLDIDSRFWIRPLYVYPEHFPESLLEICESDPRVLPYFDIPLQHASPAVLKRMGRPADPDANLRLVSRIRERLPDAFLRSTFLVGFYGETDNDFERLLDFQEAAQLDWVGVFSYSPEDGTAAERFAGRLPLPGPETDARKAQLMRRQERITAGRVARLVGRELDVLIEEPVVNEPLALGRCYAHAPEVDGAVVVNVSAVQPAPGTFVRCRITRSTGLDVEAEPL